MYLLLLFLILSACNAHTEQNAKNETKTIHPEQIGSNIDTTLRLKYTTGIRDILRDHKGNIWFASHQEGVARYDGEKLTYFTIADGLTDNQVRFLKEDQAGNIWFECGRGISYFNGTQIIQVIQRNYFFKEAWSLSASDLWFKGDEMSGFNELEGAPGVYRYDGNTMNFQAFPQLTSDVESAFHFSVSTAAVKAKNGSVWFGTYGAVIGYDGIDFTVIDDKYLGFTKETGYLHIRSLFEDSKGTLWIGNNGIGVLKMEGDSITNFSLRHGLVAEDSGHSGGQSPSGTLEHVFAIAEDSQGNMWFGDRDTGAWKFDGKSFRNYTEKDGLTTAHLWAIYEPWEGEIWLAMGDGAVCRLNGDTFERVF